MSQVRTNPLPPGRYWITASGNAIPVFEAWLKANAATVKLEHEEIQPAQPTATTRFPGLNFYIFTVVSPTGFVPGIGFPNTAGPEVQTMADTANTPPPGGLFDGFGGFDGTTVLIVAALAYLFMRD